MGYGQLRTRPEALVEMIPLFRHQLEHCRLHEGERLVAVTDSAFHSHYAAAALGAALDLGAEAFEVLLPHAKKPSERMLRSIFEAGDIILYATTHTLHYADAMRQALDEGKRALMVVVPPHVLERRLADPEVIARTRRVASRLDGASSIRLQSAAGTDLTLSVEGRPAVPCYGVADEPGHLDFWGAGFCEMAVVEGSAEGRLVLNTGDLIFHFARHVDRPVTLTFQGGRVDSIEGGMEAHLLRMALEAAGEPQAFMAGHLACGTDKKALCTAEVSQFPVAGGGGVDAESFYGNIQVELGSNNDVMLRGKNASKLHLGLCCLDHTMVVDGDTFIDKGALTFGD